MAGVDFRAALVASCLRGAFPPVDLRAVCLDYTASKWKARRTEAPFLRVQSRVLLEWPERWIPAAWDRSTEVTANPMTVLIQYQADYAARFARDQADSVDWTRREGNDHTVLGVAAQGPWLQLCARTLG